jgi:DNA-binding response OmpR family regulator
MRPTVLIADADELLAAAYRAFLVAEGFNVCCVTSGLDCLAHIRRQTPQALIVDAELPWGSGEGVLEMLAHEVALPHVPAVLLTARPEVLARQDRGIGAITLLKPVMPGRMAHTLRALLEAGELV